MTQSSGTGEAKISIYQRDGWAKDGDWNPGGLKSTKDREPITWSAKQNVCVELPAHILRNFYNSEGIVDLHFRYAYDLGEGVPRDDKQALYWYSKAAEQGHADAQTNLGWMYRNGEGVPQDDRQAVDWYTKAAEQGYTNAQYNLGVMYCNGRGVPKDSVLAYQWWNLAAAQGQELARQRLDTLEPKMTPEQIAEAQRPAREWKPR